MKPRAGPGFRADDTRRSRRGFKDRHFGVGAHIEGRPCGFATNGGTMIEQRPAGAGGTGKRAGND